VTAWTAVVVLVPGLPAALALAAARPSWRRGVEALAPWAALPAIAAAFGPDVRLETPWLLLGGALGVDGLARPFLFFTGALWLLAGFFAGDYLRGGRSRFFAFHLLALCGNAGLLVAGDAVTFYAFFALMSFAAYPLVVHEGDREARRAGGIYLGLVVIGELLLFAGLVAASADGATLRFGEGARAPGGLVAALLCAGLGVKAGVVPLHVWLPLAHPAAPAPASAVLSGAMIKAGLIGWLRMLPLLWVSGTALGEAFLILGLLSAFYGVLMGLVQPNPKAVLAYSSVSQMGWMTLGVGAGLVAPEGWETAATTVALFALHHGLAKGALFMGLGALHAAPPGRALAFVRGGMAVAALSLAGAPWTAGTLAKGALKEAVDVLPAPWPAAVGVLLFAAGTGTALLMARVLVLAWAERGGEGRWTPRLWGSWAALTAAAVLAPWFWAGPHVAPALAPGSAAAALLPVGAGALLAWVATWSGVGRRLLLPIPPGDLLELLLRAGRALASRGPVLRVTWPSREPGPPPVRGPSGVERRLALWSVMGGTLLLVVLALLTLFG
jgi:hydrogenase-4 component B